MERERQLDYIKQFVAGVTYGREGGTEGRREGELVCITVDYCLFEIYLLVCCSLGCSVYFNSDQTLKLSMHMVGLQAQQ